MSEMPKRCGQCDRRPERDPGGRIPWSWFCDGAHEYVTADQYPPEDCPLWKLEDSSESKTDTYTPEELLERLRTRRPVGEYDGEIVREVLEEMFRRVAEISETARCLQQEVWDADLQIARVRRIHVLCREGFEANDKEHGTDYQRGCAYAFGVIKAKLYEALYVADRELTPEEIAYGLTLQSDAESALKKDESPHGCPPDPKSGASATTR